MGSRALIIKDNKILLMHRIREGFEYYVLPGGAIEGTESEEEAVIREVKEETNLDCKTDKQLWSIIDPHTNKENHFFLVTEFSGTIQLGGPELERQSEENQYMLEWHELSEVAKLNLLPVPLKEKVMEEFSNL